MEECQLTNLFTVIPTSCTNLSKLWTNNEYNRMEYGSPWWSPGCYISWSIVKFALAGTVGDSGGPLH